MSEEKKKRTGETRENAAGGASGEKTTTAKKKKTVNDAEQMHTEEKKKTSSRSKTAKEQPKEQTKAVPPPASEKKKKEKKEPNPSSVGNQLAMVLLIVFSIFIGICYAFRDDVGIIGYAINYCLFGLFGAAAFLVPFLLLQLALFWRRDVLSGAVKFKYLVAIFVLLFSSVMVHTIYCIAADVPKATVEMAFTWHSIKGFFTDGVDYHGGGFFGGLLASALICAFGYPGTILFGSLFLIGFAMALFGLTPIECLQRYRFYRQRNRAAQRARKDERDAKREEREKQEREAEARARAEQKAYEAAKRAADNRKKAETNTQNTKKRADNIDRDIFADDAAFGNDPTEPAPEKDSAFEEEAPAPVSKKEKLRPVSVIEPEEEKVSLESIFDQKKDEEVLSRYADGAKTDEEAEAYQTEAHMQLKPGEKNLSGTAFVSPGEIDADEDMQYLIPVKKTKTEPQTTSAPVADEKKAYEPMYRSAPVEKTAVEEAPKARPAPVYTEPKKAEQTPAEAPIQIVPPAKPEPAPVSDVISIRPPEMSVPAPSTEADEDTVDDIPKPREYEFPPIDLLAKPQVDKGGDVSAELRENADRIIQTLDSFNVRVGISNVSRGPTITRYEIEPAPGTRVRSIINLLDDIALSLATSGVRSDGIISGKSAIGIEVPNKKTNTVFVRELIEDSRFESAKSKLTASLGMDVSGAPVYLDIAKMPHLLIAGATGQGKSVCINSLIISLLYKARPDEVKLILIDPKKVELNVYNGLPHLLVPVVFDPKKAAGSLHWAVQEMERRFELIEAQHVRNIAQYNAAIADDPLKEKLPQVVIIIDELADLMMSAPDDVETSICRLAQKARAAGMHLIIGTQRPSTDVITGLIKANIPSRIAFTVSNQIDSRIIIDTQGAEKLIGKGDMLFSPVGSSKPIRVQGSFVSEKEIEDVIDFIKAQSTEATYSDDIIKEIEKNAAVCGQKKGKAAASSASADAAMDDGEDVDPMLDAAIELAVESGKISTSLIQRRLSLGYGRAAKLIDVMEKRGIVSPPEGQKPRAVLISREQYLEMKMNHDDSEAAAGAEDEPPFDL